MKEFILAPSTPASAAPPAASRSRPTRQQKFLYISDLTNNHIWFLNREDGKVVGQLGSMGENGGQFFGLHMIAIDSKGNIYTGEVFDGERVQRSCRPTARGASSSIRCRASRRRRNPQIPQSESQFPR